MKNLFYLLLLFCFPINLFAGGGWPEKKGDGFFLLSQRFIVGNGYFNNQGGITGSPKLGAYTTHFYGEYGLTDKITGIVHSPFVTGLTRDGGVDGLGNVFIQDRVFGFGDVDLGIKYNFWNKGVYLSTELTLGLPTGNYNAGKNGDVHLGDGEFNQLLKVYASKGFKYGVFGTVFGGFNNRTNGFSDEWHYGAELGIEKYGVTLIGKLYSKQSLFNAPRKDSQIPGIYSDNLEYFSYSFQMLYTFKGKYGVMFEYGSAGDSRNIIAAKSYTFGLFFKLRQADKKGK